MTMQANVLTVNMLSNREEDIKLYINDTKLVKDFYTSNIYHIIP